MRVWAAAACATLRGLSHRRDHGAFALDLAGTVTVVAAEAGGDASKPVVGRAERAAHPASGCFGAPKSCFGTRVPFIPYGLASSTGRKQVL